MDIVLVLDVLNTDVMSGFSSLLAFINDVIDRFPPIGRQTTRVALVTYAEHPRVEIFLDDFDSKDDLQVTFQLRTGPVIAINTIVIITTIIIIVTSVFISTFTVRVNINIFSTLMLLLKASNKL